MALVVLGRRGYAGRPLATSVAAELPIVVFGPAPLTLTGSVPVVTTGAPIWLPAGAAAYADFVGDNYYANGAVTTLGAMFENDEVHWHFWDGTTAVTGLVDNAPKLAPTVAAAFLPGATFVFDWTISDGAVTVEILANDFDPDVGFVAENATMILANYHGSESLSVGSAIGTHRAAVTITTTRIAVSVDGAAVQAATYTLSGAFQLIGLRAQFDAVLKTVTFYEPKDNTALPALSA